MTSPRLLSASRRRFPRGSVMLEAIIASAVFAIGVVGAFQGIVFASRQNAMANRIMRATAIAQQIRTSMEVQAYTRLTGSGGALAATPTSNGTIKAQAGGLEGLPGAQVIDLDAYEGGAAAGLRLQPLFSGEDQRIYKRVLVLLPPKVESGVTISRNIGIVVSWQEMGRQQYHKQWLMLLAPTMDNGSILL
ncbi:MAG: hypothetical protein QM765_50670 [Myxococcales bacterium]